jgi:uncharacterized protein YqgC (DUF456 family)
MEIVIAWIIITFLMLIGLAGTIIPALPGNPIIFLGALVYAFVFGVSAIGVTTLSILLLAAILAQVFDYLAGAYGAKKMGSTAWGVWGSIIFGIIGMIIGNVIGMILGLFLGAIMCEFIFARKNLNHSLKVGLGSVLGFLGGTVLKFILGIAMIIIFLVAVF